MTKLFIASLLLSTLFLGGCIHKMDIPQGNVLDPAALTQLHTGMTREAVIKTIGSEPILLDTFRANRMNYVYTFKPGGKKMTEQYVILTFEKDRLVKIEK